MNWFKTNKTLRRELDAAKTQLTRERHELSVVRQELAAALRREQVSVTKSKPPSTTTKALKAREYVPPRAATPPPKPRPSPSYYSPPPPPAPAPSTSLADIAIGAAIGYGISSLLSDDSSSSSSSSCSNDTFSSGGGGDFGGGGASGSWD